MPELHINDCELHYELLGSRSSDCVVFIPGLGMPLQTWRERYAAPLADSGYSILLFNLRGTAPSETTPPPYSLELLADDCSKLIEALGFQRVLLVGYSLGSRIAAHMVLRGLSAVTGLFLVAPHLGRSSACGAAIIEAEGAIYKTNSYPPPSYMALCDLLQICSWRELVDDRTTRSMLRAVSATDYRDVGRQAQFFAATSEHDDHAQLHRIAVKTRVIGFEQDVITPSRLCAEVATAIPGAQYLEISGAGHAGFFVRRNEILAALRRFVEELGWSTAACADSAQLARSDT